MIHVNTFDSAKGYFVSSRGGGGISFLPVLCLIVLSILILVLVNFVMQPTAIFLVLWDDLCFRVRQPWFPFFNVA